MRYVRAAASGFNEKWLAGMRRRSDVGPRRVLRLLAAATVWVLTSSLATAVPPLPLPNEGEQPPQCGPWRWVHPLPQGNSLEKIVVGGGQFVAVGGGGVVMESLDGVEWNVGNGGTSRRLYDAIQDGDRWIGVGDNVVVVRSVEGTWSLAQTVPDTEFHGVARGAGLYVAVGSELQYPRLNGSIYVSVDGTAWTRRGAVSNEPLYDVTWTGERFVAVGGRYGLVGGRGVILTSDDGTKWTETVVEDAITMQAVASNGGDVVAGGWYCAFVPVGSCAPGFLAAVSHDGGSNWSAYAFTDNSARGVLDLTWTGSEFLGVTVGNTWMSSVDGDAWRIGSIEPSSAVFRSIASDGSRTVAIGSRGAITTSGDRESWRTVGDGAQRPALVGLARAGEYLIAASSYADSGPLRVATSRNGLVWSWSTPQVQTRSSGFAALATDGSTFVALDGTRILATTEPSIWHEVYVPPSPHTRVSELLWTGERFLVVGHETNGDAPLGYEGVVLTSPDGWQWSQRSRVEEMSWGAALAGHENLLLVLTQDGRVLRSTDGDAWSQVGVLPSGGHLAAGNGRFVVVVRTEPPGYFVSLDGASWTKIEENPVTEPYDVRWNGTEFVVFGRYGEIASSGDGSTWRTETTNGEWGITDMTLWRSNRIAVGWGQAILVSDCDPEPRVRRILRGAR